MRDDLRFRRCSSFKAALGIVALLALILSGCSASSAVAWQGLGPDAQSIISVSIGSQTTQALFAGSAGQGLFRSLDGGSTWVADNTGLPQGITVNSIVVDPVQLDLVYLGTDVGTFLSTDDGDHWKKASQGLPSGTDGAVTALLISPADSSTLYAGTMQKGVYVSHDGATSWSASAEGLPAGAAVHALLAEPKGQGLVLYAALAGAGVYQSGDGGASWSARNTGLPAGTDGLSLLVQPSNPGGLYVGTSAGIYRSTDEGASWKAANHGLGQTPPQIFALALNDQQPLILYAGTSTGAYHSSDGGANWEQVASGLPAGRAVMALAIASSSSALGTVYAAAGEVYRYPGNVSTTAGRIITFVVIGILIALFFLLFRQQHRLLQRISPPPAGSAQPRVRAGWPGFPTPNARGERTPDATRKDDPAAPDAESDAASDRAGSEGHC